MLQCQTHGHQSALTQLEFLKNCNCLYKSACTKIEHIPDPVKGDITSVGTCVVSGASVEACVVSGESVEACVVSRTSVEACVVPGASVEACVVSATSVEACVVSGTPVGTCVDGISVGGCLVISTGGAPATSKIILPIENSNKKRYRQGSVISLLWNNIIKLFRYSISAYVSCYATRCYANHY